MQDSPHSITLDRTMDVIIPYLPEILVPRPCLSRMMAYAQTLPASLTHFFIFETRLSPKLDHADFALYPKREEGLSQLAHGPLNSDPHDRYFQDEAWDRIQSFCQSCLDRDSSFHDNIAYLWLEYDIDPEGKDLKTPGLFFGFERDRLRTAPGHDPLKHQRATDSGRFFHEALGMLLSSDMVNRCTPQLVHCFDHLPVSVDDIQIGILFSRPINHVRLWLDSIHTSELSPFLEKIGLTEALPEFEKSVLPYLRYTNFVFLDLDIGSRISPPIGVEFYMSDLLKLGRQETTFIDRLTANNLCSLEKMKALLNWPGMSREHFSHIPGETKVYRSINHIKLSFRQGADLEAKAYLLVDIVV